MQRSLTLAAALAAALFADTLAPAATPAAIAQGPDEQPAQPAARIWSPSVALNEDAAPTLQSEPSVAIGGAHTVVAWTDSRNALPDVYAAAFTPGGRTPDRRVTNAGPHFYAQRAFGASVVVEPSGRAFAAYSDGENIFLARYDVAAGAWLSRTQVSIGLAAWHAVAKAPQLASDGNGNLAIVWEDYRNDAPENDGANSKGSDIFSETCDGNTMICNAPNTRINDDNGRADQRRPRIGRAGNAVVVVWEDHRERGAESPRVFASFSSNGGQTWSPNQRVNRALDGSRAASSPDAATNPAVAYTPGGVPFAVWENRVGSASAAPDIYAAQWTGADWATPMRVDDGPPGARARWPAIAASTAGTFLAWQDDRAGGARSDIYTARWTGGGWSEMAAVAQPGIQAAPALAASGSEVRLAWQDARDGQADVYLATWNGSAWSNASQVNESQPRAPYQMAPRMASNGGQTYVAFFDQREGYAQLYLSRLGAGGGSTPHWDAAIPFPTSAARGSSLPGDGADIAMDGSGALHAVWSEYIWPDGTQVQHSAYANGRWSDPAALTGGPGDFADRYAPSVAANAGAVAVAWSFRDTSGSVRLYAAWNTGAGTGAAWSSPTLVTPQPDNAWIVRSSSALAADNTLYVAWSQDGANGRSQIMVARRNIGQPGSGWSYAQVSPSVNSDWCQQVNPQLRVDAAGRAHLVWSGCGLRNPPNAWPHDSYVFYSTSSDSGASWSAPLRVGLTVAQNDEAFSNDTSSRPALAIGPADEVLVLYPSRIGGAYAFYASLVTRTGATFASSPAVLVSDNQANWAHPDEYLGEWYDGDSAGAAAYHAAGMRYVVTFPDRRNQRSPRIYTAAFGDPGITLSKTFAPLIRR